MVLRSQIRAERALDSATQRRLHGVVRTEATAVGEGGGTVTDSSFGKCCCTESLRNSDVVREKAKKLTYTYSEYVSM